MRTNGILMHISSLPSKFGIGTFGKEAYRFVDFLKKAGQTYWQILPLCPTSFGDSPYMSFSSFAGNPYFIDLDLLCEAGLLLRSEYESLDWGENPTKVDYALMYRTRFTVLRKAFARFDTSDSAYAEFCGKNAAWLEDYALFMALKDKNGGAPFTAWDKSLRSREPAAISTAKSENAESIEFYRFLQYQFTKQWTRLKGYANKNGIKIIGDLPIYVAYDSSDLWASPNQFLLDADGAPSWIAGCPPDAFSADGQVWGNPIYDWETMRADGYSWWKRRVGYMLGMYDVIRIDHFRGFDTYWCIPAGDDTAVNGSWRKGPGKKLFDALTAEYGKLPIIAEDLGMLLPSVYRLLKSTGYPGMKVLQFAFDPKADSTYLPHKYNSDCVVYTGTHDNDTIMGWFTESGSPEERKYAEEYLRLNTAEGFAWGMMKAAMASAADTCILMMQDIIGLSGEARINTPATLGGNWEWRIDGGCINDWLAQILYKNTVIYHRIADTKYTASDNTDTKGKSK